LSGLDRGLRIGHRGLVCLFGLDLIVQSALRQRMRRSQGRVAAYIDARQLKLCL